MHQGKIEMAFLGSFQNTYAIKYIKCSSQITGFEVNNCYFLGSKTGQAKTRAPSADTPIPIWG